jgi:hypothetical protein
LLIPSKSILQLVIIAIAWWSFTSIEVQTFQKPDHHFPLQAKNCHKTSHPGVAFFCFCNELI